MKELNYSDLERFIGRFSIGRDSNPLNEKGSLHFLRIKVPRGLLTSNQLYAVADLAERYGRGRGEITDRQDIQLHWIKAEDAVEIFQAMDEIGFTTDMCGQGFSGPRYGDVRNIVCCPASGIEMDELINVYPLVERLTDFFIGNHDFQDMPRKFKISVSGCGSDCIRAEINDLGLVAVEKDDEVGFTMLVGGGVGASMPGPRLAQPTSIFIRPEDAYDIAIATVEIHRDHGNRESKSKARFKWLINDWGIKRFRMALEEKFGKKLENYDGPIYLNDNDHSGIRPQSQEAYCYVNVPLIGGLMTIREMIILAELAKEHGNSELRLTPQQNVIIPNIIDEKMVIKKLERSGFNLGGSKLWWNSMGCASDFCGKTKEPHAKEIVNDIINHLETCFDSEFLNDAKFQIYASGCPNNCCAAEIAGIGLEGKLFKEGGEMKQYYSLLVGGGPGRHYSARQIDVKVSANELKYTVETLLERYRKGRRAKESLEEFCNRHHVDDLKSYLITVNRP